MMDVGKNAMLLPRLSVVVALVCSVMLGYAQDGNTQNVAEEAFEATMEGISPLSQDQIKDVRRAYNSMNKATAFTQDVPPTPLTSSLTVDLSTGATPPVIRLAAGYITSLVFSDASGEPWPIKAYDIGNPNAFNIVWNQTPDAKEGETLQNTLLVQSMVPNQEGNIAIIMKGLNTPIMFTLIPGQKVVDYRVDIRIPRMGPGGKVKQDGYPEHASPVLQDVLNNIAPPKARILHISGGEASGWVVGKRMYIRTPLTIISPAWTSTMSGSDGFIKAYELPKASVILALAQGKMLTLKVEGL